MNVKHLLGNRLFPLSNLINLLQLIFTLAANRMYSFLLSLLSVTHMHTRRQQEQQQFHPPYHTDVIYGDFLSSGSHHSKCFSCSIVHRNGSHKDCSCAFSQFQSFFLTCPFDFWLEHSMMRHTCTTHPYSAFFFLFSLFLVHFLPI